MRKNIEKISPKHVFLHLFSISMLYITTINFLTLVFQFINKIVKDQLISDYGFSLYNSHNLVRFALASIIIVFPLFIWSSWYLNKLYLKTPQIRQMKIRKWLIYLTLFILALVVVGDFIRIVWVFLGGEVTLRFILKALVVLLTSGGIFGYYIWDVRREKPSKISKYFLIAVSILILLFIILGITMIGSPKQERLMRFDSQKIMALQEIQYQIINYWQSKEKLPASLQELEDPISGFMIQRDPQTQKSFEYILTGENSFELCAEFNLINNSDMGLSEPKYFGLNSSNWNHESGRFCFQRTIDKDLYPPFKKM